MLRLRLLRIWAVCTKQYRKTLKTLRISRVKRQTYHKLTTIVSGKVSDMYEADACTLQVSAFSLAEIKMLRSFCRAVRTEESRSDADPNGFPAISFRFYTV